jgi:chaperonin GroES
MMDFEPTHDRILVEKLDGDEKTPGGIIIPDNVVGRNIKCRVLKVGPGRRQQDGTIMACCCKPGDLVLVSRFVIEDLDISAEFKAGGARGGITHDNEILGIFREGT